VAAAGIVEKVQNIRNAGGVALLLYQHILRHLYRQPFPSPGTSFPAGTVSLEDGRFPRGEGGVSTI
jgi:hypothetical protein